MTADPENAYIFQEKESRVVMAESIDVTVGPVGPDRDSDSGGCSNVFTLRRRREIYKDEEAACVTGISRKIQEYARNPHEYVCEHTILREPIRRVTVYGLDDFKRYCQTIGFLYRDYFPLPILY
jgi:hypothetical protein